MNKKKPSFINKEIYATRKRNRVVMDRKKSFWATAAEEMTVFCKEKRTAFVRTACIGAAFGALAIKGGPLVLAAGVGFTAMWLALELGGFLDLKKKEKFLSRKGVTSLFFLGASSLIVSAFTALHLGYIPPLAETKADKALLDRVETNLAAGAEIAGAEKAFSRYKEIWGWEKLSGVRSLHARVLSRVANAEYVDPAITVELTVNGVKGEQKYVIYPAYPPGTMQKRVVFIPRGYEKAKLISPLMP